MKDKLHKNQVINGSRGFRPWLVGLVVLSMVIVMGITAIAIWEGRNGSLDNDSTPTTVSLSAKPKPIPPSNKLGIEYGDPIKISVLEVQPNYVDPKSVAEYNMNKKTNAAFSGAAPSPQKLITVRYRNSLGQRVDYTNCGQSAEKCYFIKLERVPYITCGDYVVNVTTGEQTWKESEGSGSSIGLVTNIGGGRRSFWL